MGKVLRLGFLISAVAALLPLSVRCSAEDLTIAVYDYPPLGVVEGELRPGYCYEIAKRIFTGYGYNVMVRFHSLPRAIRKVERQKIDLLCTITKFHSGRLKLGSVPNATLKYHFWKVRDSDFEFTGLDSLKGRTVIDLRPNFPPVRG